MSLSSVLSNQNQYANKQSHPSVRHIALTAIFRRDLNNLYRQYRLLMNINAHRELDLCGEMSGALQKQVEFLSEVNMDMESEHGHGK
jgi:hypothetical protein